MNEKINFQFDIENKIKGLELQKQRISTHVSSVGTPTASPVHDVDFYTILLRRLYRELEEVARYDSRVANLIGKNKILLKKMIIYYN